MLLRMLDVPLCKLCAVGSLTQTNVFVRTIAHEPWEKLAALTDRVRSGTAIKKITSRKQIVKEIEKKKKISRQGNLGTPIIICKRPELNHHKGQVYGKFDTVPLASKGWSHRQSKGDYFIINCHEENPAVKDSSENASESFSAVGLDPMIVDTLEKMGFTRPTNIQVLGIPQVLTGADTLITAETGCGKTLTYLAPLIQQVLHQKAMLNGKTKLNSPLALVLSPNRELATQIADITKEFAMNLPISPRLLVGGRTKRSILNAYFEEIDILVSTLGALSKFTTAGIYDMSMVSHIVLDEADTLLDDSFNEKLTHFLKRFQIRSPCLDGESRSNTQLTFVAATTPRSMADIMKGFLDYESLVKVETAHLHRLMPHVPQKFLRLGKIQKPGELLQLVKADVNQKKAVIIFSNKSSTCDWISLFLNENNVKCVNLHAKMPVPIRRGKFEMFQDGEVSVLSCTDIGSRGLDTTRVEHVLNYDFPMNMADYIHRCGRTGRVGSTGQCHVTNFIADKSSVELVQKLEMAARKMDSLPNVNANITRIIDSRIERALFGSLPGF